MLSAEALRLAAIEVLCPTAANRGEIPFPTLAGRRVFDSRAPELGDIDAEKDFTPVLALYTASSETQLRGEGAEASDTACTAIIEIVGELAVIATDEGEAYADALAGSDPEARLTLAAMMAQVRGLLEFSQGGILFRSLRMAVRRTEFETMAMPEYGLRWHRVFMRMHCDIPEDRLETGAAGLPEPIATLVGKLPEDSYARGRLLTLAAHFAADVRGPLETITFADDAEANPIASASDLDS